MKTVYAVIECRTRQAAQEMGDWLIARGVDDMDVTECTVRFVPREYPSDLFMELDMVCIRTDWCRDNAVGDAFSAWGDAAMGEGTS